MDIALTVLALTAGGLTLQLYAVAQAPLGHPDEHGFHLGAKTHEAAEDRPGEDPS